MSVSEKIRALIFALPGCEVGWTTRRNAVTGATEPLFFVKWQNGEDTYILDNPTPNERHEDTIVNMLLDVCLERWTKIERKEAA